MPQIESVSEELKPTFVRLLKIYWSQFWRAVLILIPVFISIFAFGAFISLGPDHAIVFPNTKYLFIAKFSCLFYATSLVMLYFLQCLLFRLIIGITYADFTLSFVPKKDWRTPGFWPALFRVSWAYFWRTSLIMILIKLAEAFFPNFFDSTVVNALTFAIETLIYTLFLYFVVNQQYGSVRLSLLKPEIKDS